MCRSSLVPSCCTRGFNRDRGGWLSVAERLLIDRDRGTGVCAAEQMSTAATERLKQCRPKLAPLVRRHSLTLTCTSDTSYYRRAEPEVLCSFVSMSGRSKS